jgi:hypothetical protein
MFERSLCTYEYVHQEPDQKNGIQQVGTTLFSGLISCPFRQNHSIQRALVPIGLALLALVTLVVVTTTGESSSAASTAPRVVTGSSVSAAGRAAALLRVPVLPCVAIELLLEKETCRTAADSRVVA